MSDKITFEGYITKDTDWMSIMETDMKPVVYVSPVVYKTLREDSSLVSKDLLATGKVFSIEMHEGLTGNQVAIPDPAKLKHLNDVAYDDMLLALKRLGEWI